MLRETLVT